MNDKEQERAVNSIEKVQEAEGAARLILDEAKKRKEKKISDAQLAALKIIEDSEAATNKEVEALLKKADDVLAQLSKKKLADAKRASDKLKKTAPGKQKLERFAAQAANEIVGA
jgi:vacuolar-type H+-ATPase subunit H